MKEELRKITENLWTFPNVLTMLRILMIPVFVILYLCGHSFWALGVFVLASLTDAFDGYLARKNNQITEFGKLMDPFADKLMVCSVLLCFVLRGVFPLPALLIVSCKELFMVFGSMYMLQKGVVVHSIMVGKVATCLFIASIILGFFHDQFSALGVQADVILLWISIPVALAALTVYILQSKKALDAMKESKPE